MYRGIQSIEAQNFGILGKVHIPSLARLSVLVGPNGSGKSTVLRVIQFLGDAARLGLFAAVEEHGGFSRLMTRPSQLADRPVTGRGDAITIRVKTIVTKYASENAPDEYQLRLRPIQKATSARQTVRAAFFNHERFKFKRTAGKGRRLTLAAGKLHIQDEGRPSRRIALDAGAFGLAVLPQLGTSEGSTEVKKIQELFTTFRVFDIDARAARRPTAQHDSGALRHDASNLASFLAYLHDQQPDSYSALVADARQMVPGLAELQLRPVGGPVDAVAIDIVDQGRSGATPLADASFGTVRALALLAMLYDPAPPLLTCVEEIDHGLHPHVFDRLVDLLREASKRSQFLVATHSPALVNRLRAEELIVCERDARTGLARIPAIDAEEVRQISEGGDLGLGELWFCGSLGGVPR